MFSASARIVTLAQPVSGIANVLVSTDTVVVGSNGATGAVGDLVARAAIEVTGRPSTPDTLIARRIVLL